MIIVYNSEDMVSHCLVSYIINNIHYCTSQKHKPQLCLSIKASISLIFFRKKWNLFVVSPADDAYYRWLFVIATAVLYNWFLVVAR